jgi:hypothetical protein
VIMMIYLNKKVTLSIAGCPDFTSLALG